MLPCERGVYLHNSASSKQKTADAQTNHNNDAKMTHEALWKSIKNPS